MAAETQEQPSRMLGKPLSFDLRSQNAGGAELRVGRLSFHGRTTVDTPHYVALSSRGAVPHLTQDLMRDNTAIKGIYAALEDCE